jgi:hypothetical protein
MTPGGREESGTGGELEGPDKAAWWISRGAATGGAFSTVGRQGGR